MAWLSSEGGVLWEWGIAPLFLTSQLKFFLSTARPPRICSHEHENISLASLGANIAQIHGQTSTDGVEFMESAQQSMKAALEAIRDTALSTLNQIGQSQEECSMRWKCQSCQYIKHFTKAVSLEAAGRYPRCKCTEFKPIL